MTQKLSPIKALIYTCEQILSHFSYFFKLELKWLCLLIIPPMLLITNFLSIQKFPLLFLLSLLASLASILIGLFLYIPFLIFLSAKIILNYYDHGVRDKPISDAFNQFKIKKILKLCALLFFMNILISIAFILIIPGIYLATRWQFASLYLIEHDCGIIEALEKSYNLTNNNFFRCFIFLCLSSVLFIFKIVFFPFPFLLEVYAYRTLQKIQSAS